MIDPQSEDVSFVYVWGGEGTYKIGYSNNPQQRIKAFPVMPYPCDFAHIIPALDAPAVERHLHEYFTQKGRLLRGEWFGLTQEDLWELPGVALNASSIFMRSDREWRDEILPIPLSTRHLVALIRAVRTQLEMEGQREDHQNQIPVFWALEGFLNKEAMRHEAYREAQQ